MATIIAPSSLPSGGGNDDHIPTATLALPSIAASAASGSGSGSRRLPPPCWSAEETVALIEAYKDKWYSLRRGNLRANHWQEVADDVASRCPASPASPAKTAVQCRHKMEKLRKRYRTEIQRAAAHGGVRRFSSSWVHFQRMHSMEMGPNPTPPSSSDDEEEEEEEEDHKRSIKRINDLCSYNQKAGIFSAQGPEYNGAAASGFRIKIPGRNTPGPSNVKISSNFDQMGIRNPNFRFNNFVTGVNGSPSGEVLRDGFAGRVEMGKRDAEIYKKKGVDELVAAIHSLGEGFARVEMAKMDMLRKVEEMRMDMEMKRTEMILHSQQKILEAFAHAMSERSIKRTKRSCSTPPE